MIRILLIALFFSVGCQETVNESEILRQKIGNLEDYILPESDDYDAIPQDPLNPITKEKVELGKLLFNDERLGQGLEEQFNGTFSCASCHFAPAGFKAGIAQGIGEGGSGVGKDRVLIDPVNADVQPIASPTIVNTAYQEVMLWNGSLGNQIDGIVNLGIDPDILMPKDTPKENNSRQWSGLETQAAAAIGVHRLNGIDVVTTAAQAIAAYERTVLTNRAPFQKWLRGDDTAMTINQIKGAQLFFGSAGCNECHRGPALSSEPYSMDNDIFMAVGFADLDAKNIILGDVPEAVRRGRGGFTQEDSKDYKFKIPTLYNLKDTNIFGHGASFSSVREVVEYKNQAVPQSDIPWQYLDFRFRPLGLTDTEIDLLVDFLENGLYDAELNRYVPEV